MIKTRILDLPDQSATHSHAEHQLIVGLDGSAEFEVMGKGGTVNRLHACLVPSCERHAFSGRGDNQMLILDLDPLLDRTLPGDAGGAGEGGGAPGDGGGGEGGGGEMRGGGGGGELAATGVRVGGKREDGVIVGG